MNAMPLLSVVVPTYNRADDLDRAIQSVLVQPGEFFELVVGDDGSTDPTPSIVARYLADPRFRAYHNPSNLGMQENNLKICREAHGEYIFILTDDDVLLAGALGKVVQAIHAHPEAGYLLSHLTTVDERTGRVTDIHRTFSETTVVLPSIQNMAQIVGSAWVLSRQMLKRAAIDWTTWEQYRGNIFFPIINAGRILLQYPCYYIADNWVKHTWFNQLHWEKFGRTRIEIEFSLARDSHACMRAILHDYAPTLETERIIDRWERSNFKSYLYRPVNGFYDLCKALGVRRAFDKLQSAYPLDAAARRELSWFLFKIPFMRVGVNLKGRARELPFVPALREWRLRSGRF